MQIEIFFIKNKIHKKSFIIIVFVKRSQLQFNRKILVLKIVLIRIEHLIASGILIKLILHIFYQGPKLLSHGRAHHLIWKFQDILRNPFSDQKIRTSV